MTPAPNLQEAIDAFQSGDLDRARAIAERELASAPSPMGEHLLGLIHCRLGNPGQGVEHLRAAADAEPANVAYKVMLARALVDAGRPVEVLAMPEPPPVTSPAELALWQVRAEAAGAAADAEAAAGAWSKITEAAPRDWRAWANLGSALAARERWERAAAALLEAARLNPSEPAVRSDAVAALLHAGRRHNSLLRFDEAEAAFRRAHEIDPANRSVVYQLGVVLERTNQLDALAELLDHAAARGPGKNALPYLWAVRARREGRLEEARELLLQAEPDEHPIGWNALRAKLADAMGDEDEAFEAATAMNQAARAAASQSSEEWKRQADDYREQQHRLARKITPEWAARVPLVAEPLPNRVSFLVGFPRSGTTLLDTFLLGHPQVTVLEEKQLVGAAMQESGPIEGLANCSIQKIEAARATYLAALAGHVGADFSGLAVDKFPLDMGHAPLIQAMFPGAPIIFMQRHPCDVVLSAFMQPFGVVNFSDIRETADYYDAMMSIWTASREAMDLNVHTVVYEELVGDPEAALKPLLRFVGLKWDDRLLDHRQSAKERGTIVTPSYDQVTEPITTRPSGRWKRYRRHLESVLPVLLPWAERLGYRG